MAEQGGYADLLARRIVDRIQADVKPGNIEAYVRAFRPDDLRTWEQKVLGGGDPAPWDVPGARATATAADRRAHREVEQARKDEERRARDGSVPASAEVRARMADVARAAARAGTQAEAS